MALPTPAQTAQIEQLYVTYYNRPADAQGLIYWSTTLANGNPNTFASISNSFSSSAEYTSLFGVNPANQDVVNTLYQNLFGHGPDQVGLTYWTQLLNFGKITVASAAASIAAGAQGTDKDAIINKVAAATDFTAALDSTQQLAYSGSAANAQASAWLAQQATVPWITPTVEQIAGMDAVIAGITSTATTYTLTTGLDIQTATNFFASETYYNVDGKGPTLNTGDKLTGTPAAGIANNTLTVTDLTPNVANGNIPAGVTLNNIQNVILNSSNNTANGTGFSTVGIADVRTLTGMTNGGGNDRFAANNGVNGASVTITHNGYAGNTNVIGGTNVTVTTSGGDVLVGSPNVSQIPLAEEIATGAVIVNQHNTGTGSVNVLGGSSVNVTSSSTGSIEIGNTFTNTGNTVAGTIANSSGDITVTTTGIGSDVIIFGGANVTVADNAIKSAGAITVGDFSAVDPSNQPQGAVTITEKATHAFDNLSGVSHNNGVGGDISVYGGTNVTVETNAGNNIQIGDSAEKGTNPTGDVVVNDTGLSLYASGGDTGSVYVNGGKSVSVSANDANIVIGQQAGNGNTAADNTTGAINVIETGNGAYVEGAWIIIDGGSTVNVIAKGQAVDIGYYQVATGDVAVNQSDVLTGTSGLGSNGNNDRGDVYIAGGANVSVSTTGGDVWVGNSTNDTAATGAVNITNTFSGSDAVASGNTDAVSVLGGTTVNVNIGATAGDITVGYENGLNIDGITLKNANLYATGDVAINNSRTNGAVTTYGVGATNVYTNGAKTVTLTGGSVSNITDEKTTLATAGANSGKAIGTSTLANVIIDGNQASVISPDSATYIASDVLANLTLTNDTGSGGMYSVQNSTADHTLNLTVGGDSYVDGSWMYVDDNTAGTVNVSDNGKASTDTIELDALAATSFKFTNSASQSFYLGYGNDALASITASNTGSLALDLSGLSKLATIDATKATGAISAAINGSVTSFNGLGSTGNETITLFNSKLLHADGVTNSNIVGGSGNNTLIADYQFAGVSDTGSVQLGSNSHIKNFANLTLASGASNSVFDAAGFSGLALGNVDSQVGGGTTGFKDVAAGATLAINNAYDGSYVYDLHANTANDALTMTLGVDGSATTGINVGTLAGSPINLLATAAASSQSIESFSIASQGVVGQTNYLKIVNGTADAAKAQTVTITGDSGLTLTGFAATDKTVQVKTITASGASGAVDVTGVALDTQGATITGGTGKLTAFTGITNTANDLITTGTGGGKITVDANAGGSWIADLVNNYGSYAAGSETINLSASAAKTDTLVIKDGAIATYNGTKGGVTGFVTGVTASDALSYAVAGKSVIANQATAVYVEGATGIDTFGNAASVLDGATAGVLEAKLSNLTFTSSNGVITFSATGGHQLADFTSGELISAAEIILANIDNGAGLGKNNVAAFSTGGSSYVVASDNAVATLTDKTGANADSIINISGLAAVSGFGLTGAAGAIVANVQNNDANGPVTDTGTGTTHIFDDTGYSLHTLNTNDGNTYNLNNLAASSQIILGSDTHSTGGANVSVNQLGTSGNNSLTVSFGDDCSVHTLTVTGDANLTMDNNGSSSYSGGVDSLVDASNTLKTITVSGAATNDVNLFSVTSTSLKTVDASSSAGYLYLGTDTALSQAGLTVKLSAAAGGVVFASGAADVITQAAGVGHVSLTANGAGDTISILSTDSSNDITALGAGDTITVGTGGFTVQATGAHDILNITTGSGVTTATIGSNAVVNFTGTAAHNDVIVLGNDVTGGTSASYNFTTLTGFASGDVIDFTKSGVTPTLYTGFSTDSQVNVATATSLINALDIAANISALEQVPGTATFKMGANQAVVDWFQYAGNTYIVEAVNATNSTAVHTALGANDVVVQITGLVDLSAYAVSGNQFVV